MSNQLLAELPTEVWAEILDHCRPTPASPEAGVTLLAQTAALARRQKRFFALRQVFWAAAYLRPSSLHPIASHMCYCLSAGLHTLQPSFR